MQGQPGGRRDASPAKNLLFFAILLTLGVLFFALVRDNRFWHPGDYQYLIQSLRIAESWRAIFAQDPHDTFQPLINLVWYGLYIMLAGGTLATVKRFRGSGKVDSIPVRPAG